MKILLSILFTVLITGCVSSNSGFAIRDSGDKVYRGSSPTSFVYMNGYYGFPYYGPYAWRWYYPYWYSPLNGPHYSWYRPHGFWGAPCIECSQGYIPPDIKQPGTIGPAQPRPAVPILPVDLREMAVRNRAPKSSLNQHAYRTPQMKARSAAKYGSNKSASRSSARSPASYRSPSRSSSRATTARIPTIRRTSENID